MRSLVFLLLTGCTSAATNVQQVERTAAPAIAPPEYTADAYTSCSACHLDNGAGIPGAFPPLRNRVAAIARLDGGREYLVAVASFGLMGSIEVDGLQYFGVMPGNKGLMSNQKIASALNYAVFELAENDASTKRSPPFTADEVASVQSGISNASMAAAQALRNELLERHGEQWPK